MVFSTTLVFSQALISDEETPATVDGNAMLEIRTSDVDNPGGLLIPRVNLSLAGTEVILSNMETPTDGLLIYNLGSHVEAGLWYYDGGSGTWVLYSRAGSIYSLSVDNYGEIWEDNEGSGTGYTLTSGTWTGWASGEGGTESPQFTADYTTNAPGGPGSPGDFLLIDATANPAYYTLNVSMVVKSNSSGNTFIAQLWMTPSGGTAQKIGGAFVKHHFQTGDEFATLATSALVLLGPGDKVDVRMQTTTAIETIDVEGMNLRLAKVGESATP